VETTTPCANKTSNEEKQVNQQLISGKRIFAGNGSSGSSRRSISTPSSIQVSTSRESGTTKNFTMVGQDHIIRLPEFHGEGSEDLEKHLFICENIWEAKKVTEKYTKVSQLEITFRYCTLYWYMGIAMNNSTRAPTTLAEVKRKLINEF
jgi:hypothetical protein